MEKSQILVQLAFASFMDKQKTAHKLFEMRQSDRKFIPEETASGFLNDMLIDIVSPFQSTAV